MVIEIYVLPHYVAPFTAAFYAIGLQMMRHLRVWKSEGSPVGLALVRFTLRCVFVMAGVRVFAEPLHMGPPEWPPRLASSPGTGPEHFGTERARILSRDWTTFQAGNWRSSDTERDHNPLNEWVYNSADIDGSKVVWAREMDTADNLELIRILPGSARVAGGTGCDSGAIGRMRISPYPVHGSEVEGKV